MSIILTISVIVLMVIGLGGVVVPLVPGLALIFLGYLLYGIFSGWQVVQINTAVMVAAVVIFSFFLDYLAAAWGAKKYGASKSGVWGALLGLFFGVTVFNFFGLIIGPIIGAFIGELLDGKPHPVAARVTIGAILGILAGTFVKFFLGISMVGVFLWQVLFGNA